jgi:RNA polymerase sigma factor (sigma-70 family)
MDDADLRQAFLSGELEACRVVAAWARQAVRSPRLRIPADEVEDLVQETLLRLVLALEGDDFTFRVGLRAFVQRIAIARAIDWIRCRRILTDLDPELATDHPDPAERLGREQELARVYGALGAMKLLCRDLVRWHFVEEEPFVAIAERTGRHAGTLRVHMLNCLRTLRSLLQA